jgi:hypothetical protein
MQKSEVHQATNKLIVECNKCQNKGICGIPPLLITVPCSLYEFDYNADYYFDE